MPEGLDKVISHASTIATCMMDLNFMVDLQWKKNISPLFTEYYDAAKAEEFVEAVRAEAEKMREFEEE